MNEQVKAQLERLLAWNAEGKLVGLIAVAFQPDGNVDCSIEGGQHVLVQVGALELTKDWIKGLAINNALRKQQEQEKPRARFNLAAWEPEGKA